MLNKKPKQGFSGLIITFMLIIQVSCTEKTQSDLTKESIIPQPVSVISTGEYFKLRSGTDVYIREKSDELKQIGQYLVDKLKLPTGFNVDLKVAGTKPHSGCFVLATDAAKSSLGEEGYELAIGKRIIYLTAAKPAGLFRGIQTIRQLLPVKIESANRQEGPWEIPTGTITDYPDYQYRGAMLDVSRHFFGVDDVKRITDLLASYAELNCDGKARELYTGTNVGFSTLCTTSAVTYKFIDDVIRELAALTPGPYIHIGGDESHVTKIEDYIPFINMVQDIVAKHGKQVIGWDEIALASLKPNTIAQCWANVKNANTAVSQGAEILMSPASKAYIDMKYDKSTKLGLNWAGYIEVDTGYIWDPATLDPGIVRDNIIGIEAPLWTETITNMDEIEYMVFPRLPGYAEIGWTPAASRSWEEYKIRLGKHGERFKAMGIDFYPSALVPWAGL